jgi:NADH-quinone oxidoreductase subunit N
MTGDELLAVLPLIACGATPLAVMIVIAVRRHHLTTVIVTLGGLGTAFALLAVASASGTTSATSLLLVDRYALFFMGLIFGATAVVTVLAYGYLKVRPGNREEFYVLLMLATLGAAILVAASHFASFLLGLEILSISLYALIGYARSVPDNIEAAIKYVILAAISASFLLFGMALVYGELGTMEFGRIAAVWREGGRGSDVPLLIGLGMLIVGIGFKLAVVPFHLWTPDIYEGAPAPVGAFIATVSKGAMFALLLRLFSEVDFHLEPRLFWIFSLIAIGSMLGGNLLALLQNNVKRLLAYSSIAHLGYLLVAFAASGSLVATAVSFYLVTYFAATLAAFGVITVMSGAARDADELDDYRGLFWTRPWLAVILTVALFSLAGIPLTAGFIGKFYLIAAGAGSALWSLLIILAAGSVIGLFYYLRVIVAMFDEVPDLEPRPVVTRLPATANAALAALACLMIGLGIYPSPLIHLIQSLVAPGS